ncbi:MAG: hypothetical protein WCH84_06490 [Verrucomicrobiota bacterium]
MSTKSEIVVFRELRKRCVMPDLFKGWTTGKAYSVIARLFSNDSTWLAKNVLHPRLRTYLKKHRQQNHWSFGYCYDIVEVAKIIFDSALKQYEPFVCKTKKTGIKGLDKHHVLKIGKYAFDPAKGGKELWQNYSRYQKSHNMPQSPSERALALYIRILDHCCATDSFTQKQKKIVAKFKLDLSTIESRLRQARR